MALVYADDVSIRPGYDPIPAAFCPEGYLISCPGQVLHWCRSLEKEVMRAEASAPVVRGYTIELVGFPQDNSVRHVTAGGVGGQRDRDESQTDREQKPQTRSARKDYEDGNKTLGEGRKECRAYLNESNAPARAAAACQEECPILTLISLADP